MMHWDLTDPVDPFIMGLLVADGYVDSVSLGGGIDMCDEQSVALVAGRFNAPYHMRNRKTVHKSTWRDQYVSQWSSGQPGGYRKRKPQLSWSELVDTGIMRPSKKYSGTNVDLIASWPIQSRMWFHAGFVEGDGHVRRKQIVIENHSSLDAYHVLFCQDTGARLRHNNRGHVVSAICDRTCREVFLSYNESLLTHSPKLLALKGFLDDYPAQQAASGVSGVYFDKTNGSWYVQVRRKTHGQYRLLEDAITARKAYIG